MPLWRNPAQRRFFLVIQLSIVWKLAVAMAIVYLLHLGGWL
jgi:hypothetical protein